MLYDPGITVYGILFDDESIIHKPIPMPGGVQVVWRASLSKYSMYRFATMGLTGDPIAAP